MIKISIVMPVYNGEAFLAQSIKSILEQSFKEFELICINDASNDQTLSILEECQDRDKRIRIISNKKHKGAAYSRNIGIKKAQGEYLAFLDGDDIFDRDMLYMAYSTAEKFFADIVEYPYKIVESKSIYKKNFIRQSTFFKEHYCRNTFSISDLEPKEFMTFHSAPWNKLFRTKFVKNERLSFQNLSCCNDVYFVNMALILAKRIIYLETDKIMVYVRDHNSTSRISSNRDPMNAFYADFYTAEQLIFRGKIESVYNQFYYRVYCHLLETVRATKDKERAKEFYIFLQSEGINNICKLNEKSNSLLNDYILDGYNKIISKDYESEWYLSEGEFKLYLNEKKDVLCNLFKEYEREDKKIGLWGVGRNGRAFLEFCERFKIELNAIYDTDPNKKGQKIANFPIIKNPEVDIEDTDVMIVTSSNILSNVVSYIKKVGKIIEVIDINEYLDK